MSVPQDNPIDVCPGCGQVWPPGAAFCDHCGLPAGATPPSRATPQLPSWLTHDWPRAAALAGSSLLALLVVCEVYGVGMGALAVGGGDGPAYGALAGLFLPFAVFGGDVLVLVNDDGAGSRSGSGSGELAWMSGGWPLVLTAVAALISYVVVRGSLRRLAPDPGRARALVVKMALVVALVLAIAGTFGNRGALDPSAGDFTRVFTGLWPGRPTVAAFVVTLLVGALALRRAGVAVVPHRPARSARSELVTRLLLAARTGAVAFLVVALVSGAVAMVVTGSRIHGVRERLALAATAPLTLAGFGTSGSAIAHGGAAGAGDVNSDLDEAVSGALKAVGSRGPGNGTIAELDPTDVVQCYRANPSRTAASNCVDDLLAAQAARSADTGAGSDAYRQAVRLSRTTADEDHISLLSWHLQDSDAGSHAPWWAFLMLVLPLAALVGSTALLLRRAQPPTQGWALGLATLLAVGYALASWLLTVLAPLLVAAAGSAVSTEGLLLHVEPSAGSSLGLPLLWGLVVSLGTAYLWSARRGLPGSALPARPPVPAVATYGGGQTLSFQRPPDVLSDPRSTADRSCAICGAGLAPEAPFCASCGSPR